MFNITVTSQPGSSISSDTRHMLAKLDETGRQLTFNILEQDVKKGKNKTGEISNLKVVKYIYFFVSKQWITVIYFQCFVPSHSGVVVVLGQADYREVGGGGGGSC